MPKMGRYCKAYPVARFREYGQWTANPGGVKKVESRSDSNQDENERQLSDTDILYLHENFVVTDGVFYDENIVFDDVSPEWVDFCTTTLGFHLPEDLIASRTEAPAGQNDESQANVETSA